MDPNAVAAAQGSGLEAWVSANGTLIQLALYATQFLFWIAMIVFVGYAVATYKRWVNYQMGVGHSGKLRNPDAAGDMPKVANPDDESFDAPASQSKEAISVEEFVD